MFSSGKKDLPQRIDPFGRTVPQSGTNTSANGASNTDFQDTDAVNSIQFPSKAVVSVVGKRDLPREIHFPCKTVAQDAINTGANGARSVSNPNTNNAESIQLPQKAVVRDPHYGATSIEADPSQATEPRSMPNMEYQQPQPEPFRPPLR